MPRPHWKTASANVQRTIRGWLTDDKPPAEAWLDAAACARSFGYDFDPPPTPKKDELERLRAKGDALALAEFRRANALAIDAEQRAAAWWASTRAWAGIDAKKQTRAHAEEQRRRAAELDTLVQARAAELRQLQHTLLPADALEQARKELGHVSP